MRKQMKICKLVFRGFRQFEHTDIDFANPATGEPANRICFIGRNGTGKSTLLELLNRIVRTPTDQPPLNGDNALLGVKFLLDTKMTYVVFLQPPKGMVKTLFFRDTIEDIPGWPDGLSTLTTIADSPYYDHIVPPRDRNKIIKQLYLADNGNDLIVYAPAETSTNAALSLNDVPETTLNQALSLFSEFPKYHLVSNSTVSEMWRVLVYLMKKRESERDTFENRPENLQKTKAELIEMFNRTHPKPLDSIAALWDQVLERAGLELDVENASNPIQLNDNLKAYIRLKSTKERINYNQLSTGIRDFMFRLGHIHLLYFGRNIERGFLMVDEPENSLFPDFLLDLLETYERVVRNEEGKSSTQMFFATHSPIIASQFEPHERIILEWNDSGGVTAKKGRAPVGDDPNDLLKKDFELTRLMGKKGDEKWQEYLSLKKKIRQTDDKTQKNEMIKKALDIGQSYGFPPANDQ